MRSNPPVFRLFATALAVLAFAVAGFAQQRTRKEAAVYVGGSKELPSRPQPPSLGARLAPAREVSLGRLSISDRGRLGDVGRKRRIGLHRELPEDALASGMWSTLADGRRIWRMSVRSIAAAGVRVEFFNFSVGAGRVWIHAGAEVDGPYTGQGPYGNGEFWSGAIAGEVATIEYESAGSAHRDAPPPFQLRRVAHHEELASNLPPQTDNAAPCALDVNCYQEVQDTKKSVAHIIFEETQGDEQGSFQCSATLLSTRNNSFKPYLLTAGHCIHDEPAARSLQTYWTHESAGCNQGPPTSLGTVKSSNGGHLLASATIESGDYSLVLLPDVPTGVVFAGWDPQPLADNAQVVGISHPHGSYKRVSFGTAGPADDAAIFQGLGLDMAPAPLYHTVTYTKGVVQQGSSGSAIFMDPGVVVGIASYAEVLPDAQLCSGPSTAGYARFSNAYPNIRSYLEDLPFSEVLPSIASLNFTGSNHTIAGSATQSFTLTTQSVSPVTFKLRTDAVWAQVTPDAGTISAATPAKVQVVVDPKYFVATGSYTTTVTVLTGAAPPVFVNVSVNMKIDVSNVSVSAIPNPVAQTGTLWPLRLHLVETNGASTQITGFKIDGVDYSAQIAAFFGATRIAALGTLDATLHTSGLVTPVTKYFELFGKDEASGQTWYREVAVTFTN